MSAAATAMPGTNLQHLARFAAATDITGLPPRMVRKAQACVLYGVSVGIAARGTAQPHIALRAEDVATPAHAAATRLLDGMRCAEGEAAFANATLFHARCQEDAHLAGHVGAVVVPAAIAAAEAAGSAGTDLLAAIVAGYEVALRIGRDHASDLSARGFRTTSAYGVFGAAAAAARLRRLDSDQTCHALALSASMAGGLRAFVAAGTDEFAYQAGFAARNGLLAAALAASGATGPTDILSGDAGFFRAFGEASRDYAAALLQDLGVGFEMEAVAYKPYPVCQFHRGIVHGLLQLRTEVAGAPAERIEIRMHPGEADFWGVRFTGPFRRFPQAFMSAPLCAALAWQRGAVRLAELHDFGPPPPLVARVDVLADPGRDRYCPHISVLLTDGRRLAWDERAGSAGFNLDWNAALDMSGRLLAESEVPDALQAGLVGAVDRLAAGGDVAAVIAATRDALMAAAATLHGRKQ
jgi:2-methylcitrate dehydratase PrpD